MIIRLEIDMLYLLKMDFSECRCLKIFIKQNSRNSDDWYEILFKIHW